MPYILHAREGNRAIKHELQSQHAALVIARALIEQGLEVRIDEPDGKTLDPETMLQLIKAL